LTYLAIIPAFACLQSHRVKSAAIAQLRLAFFRLFLNVLGISLCHHPTAEASTQRQADFGTPLEESLAFDHVAELNWLYAQLVD